MDVTKVAELKLKCFELAIQICEGDNQKVKQKAQEIWEWISQ